MCPTLCVCRVERNEGGKGRRCKWELGGEGGTGVRWVGGAHCSAMDMATSAGSSLVRAMFMRARRTLSAWRMAESLCLR